MHIHTALSPCGDADMTPNNIVNMALLKGLDVIAVTDHNSCENAAAVIAAADGRLVVVPGMEVETAEEVHMLCYFPTLDAARKMQAHIDRAHPGIENRSEIFGEQCIMNADDEIVGHERRLLVCATGLDIYSTVRLAHECGGAAVCAHIDRASYSAVSNLGFIPPDLQHDAVEITAQSRARLTPEYAGYQILTSSDAHYLENIAERENFLEIPEKSAQNVVRFLCRYN